MKKLKVEGEELLQGIDGDTHNHFLSDEIKWSIILFKKQGQSNKAIARIVGLEFKRPSISHQTVKIVWDKYIKTQGVSNQWSRVGPPLALSEEDLMRLQRYFNKNPKHSVEEAKVALELPASRPTINRALLERGIKAYRAPKKFYISPINVIIRNDFALEYENKTLNFWKKIFFSDESSFALYNANGRLLVRRQEERKRNDFQIGGNSETLMVWGIISYNGIGPLVRIDKIEEGERTLNGERYLTILKNYSNLANQKLIFQQDNAPPHRYHEVQTWLREKEIIMMNWPPQSPDMSLIENVWNEMKFRLRGKAYSNKEKLWKDLQREWKLISKEYIRGLYDSLPRRLQALKKSKGKHTIY